MHRIFRPPKFFGRKWPKSTFSVFGQNTFITETTKPKQKFVMTQTKSAASTGLSGSANMSAVWTFFNVSEKDPRIAICKNCNALILMSNTLVSTPVLPSIILESQPSSSSPSTLLSHSVTASGSAPILGDSVL